MNILSEIQRCFKINSAFYTKHAKIEMENEEFGIIFDYEICEAICNGEIIEEYIDNKPYPAVLIFGNTK